MRIMAYSVFFLTNTFLLFLGIAQANEELPLRTGVWELVTTPEIKGVPATPAPKFGRLCLDDDAIRSGKIPLYIAPACKITGGSWNGNKLHLVVTCPDAPPDAKIPAALSAQRDTFTSHIELNQMITYHHQGRWLSATCP